MNPILEEIINKLQEMDVPVAENIFLQVPKKTYATWSNIQSVANGADDYALYWQKTYAVYLHYPTQRNEKEARKIEKPIEDILRSLGTFKRVLDVSYDLQEIVIAYIFETKENFDDDEMEE